MDAESNEKKTKVTDLDVLAPSEVRRVYCSNEEALAFLAHQNYSWEVVPLPQEFSLEKIHTGVIVGDSPAVFSSPVREAINGNLLRLVYVVRPGQAVPAEAGGIPIFSFLVPPLGGTVLSSVLDGAFENLLYAREQARLKGELQRARDEIDQLNQIGIALSTQRDRESVCYERNHLCRDGSDASPTMRVGPSKSAYRRRLQTTASGVDQESSS